jgi:hypothetical protein
LTETASSSVTGWAASVRDSRSFAASGGMHSDFILLALLLLLCREECRLHGSQKLLAYIWNSLGLH